MAIILDADVIIKGAKGSFDLIGWLDSQTSQDLEIAAPSRPVLDRLDVIAYTETTAFVHARLWPDLESSGNMIGAHDLILASIALERGSMVATLNKRHFVLVPGLRVIEPKYEPK